jgi:hypothetical protein
MVYDVLAPRLNLQRHREPRGTKLQSLHLLSSVRARVVLLYDHIDRLCWNLDTTGDYTIKSGCIIIDKIIFLGVSPAASLFWKGLVPLKIEVFLWKLMSDKLCARKFLA